MKHILSIQTDRQELSLPAEDGELLLDVLRRAGIPVTASCGGKGLCGKCRVTRDGESVLACRTTVGHSSVVTLREQSGGRILTDSAVFPTSDSGRENAVLPVSTGSSELGLAVDLGTTTVAAELLDLQSGR